MIRENTIVFFKIHVVFGILKTVFPLHGVSLQLVLYILQLTMRVLGFIFFQTFKHTEIVWARKIQYVIIALTAVIDILELILANFYDIPNVR